MATGDFVALLSPQDVLPSHALYWVAEAINRNPIARLLYSDEDKIDGRGRRFQPNFRPDFNYELFLSQNMVCHLGVYRREMSQEMEQDEIAEAQKAARRWIDAGVVSLAA
jgi:hypothetical protein